MKRKRPTWLLGMAVSLGLAMMASPATSDEAAAAKEPLARYDFDDYARQPRHALGRDHRDLRPGWLPAARLSQRGRLDAGKYNSTAQETWPNCNGWLLLVLAELEP